MQLSDDTASLILEYMRRFDGRLDRMEISLSDLRDDVQAINRRMSHMEEGLALVNQRLDRIDARVTRIEKRLDLVEG